MSHMTELTCQNNALIFLLILKMTIVFSNVHISDVKVDVITKNVKYSNVAPPYCHMATQSKKIYIFLKLVPT